jgi:hypothetical protein
LAKNMDDVVRSIILEEFIAVVSEENVGIGFFLFKFFKQFPSGQRHL